MIFTDEFANYKYECEQRNIISEVIGGRVIQSSENDQEGKKLCFLLGTLLEDYFVCHKLANRIEYDPESIEVDNMNIFKADIVVYNSSRKQTHVPCLVVDIMKPQQMIYACLDKAMAYFGWGVSEYWLIDMQEQYVYYYCFEKTVCFTRYTFDQTVSSRALDGFTFSVSDIMFKDDGCLRDLALFYRFDKYRHPEKRKVLLADVHQSYFEADNNRYTAQAFYEWMDARRNLMDYKNAMQLIHGEIQNGKEHDFQEQYLQGELFFAIKQFIRENHRQEQIYFAPMAVELTGRDIFDSVLVPDLFLGENAENVKNGRYCGAPKWVIEIVSPSSATQDYVDKVQIYQYHGVKEYWIINQWKRQILVVDMQAQTEEEKIARNSQESENTKIFSFNDNIESISLPGFMICMKEMIQKTNM